MRIIAIDWSGARVGASRSIWLAEASGGCLLRLENGRGRDEVCEVLVELAASDGRLVAGLDFAFSAPAWFLHENGLRSAPELWRLAGTEGETWLKQCRAPFWGRDARRRPSLPAHLRRTDLAINVGGIAPKSVFQLGGAGSVGTGSLRGWPCLLRLREAGFSVWPFDPAVPPVAIEIYPRLLTGPVNKSSQQARRLHLERNFPGLSPPLAALAAASEDAFDAAVSALVMSQHVAELACLPAVRDQLALLEGQIWRPRGYRA